MLQYEIIIVCHMKELLQEYFSLSFIPVLVLLFCSCSSLVCYIFSVRLLCAFLSFDPQELFYLLCSEPPSVSSCSLASSANTVQLCLPRGERHKKTGAATGRHRNETQKESRSVKCPFVLRRVNRLNSDIKLSQAETSKPPV